MKAETLNRITDEHLIALAATLMVAASSWLDAKSRAEARLETVYDNVWDEGERRFGVDTFAQKRDAYISMVAAAERAATGHTSAAPAPTERQP